MKAKATTTKRTANTSDFGANELVVLDPNRTPMAGDDVLVLCANRADGVMVEPYHGQAYLCYAEHNEVIDLTAPGAAWAA